MRSREIAAWQPAIVSFILVLVCAACLPEEDLSTRPTSAPVVATTTPSAQESAEPDESSTLLFVRDLKDGDSWIASDGNEYRLGLVNTPERNEPCGSNARAFTSEYLDDGFTVDAYSKDTYGRVVAEVFDAQGNSLNVALARSGYANDKYLEQFRHENPDLGKRLDAAFAAAPVRDCLSSSRKATPAPKPQPLVQKAPKAASSCHPNYSPCLKVVQDLDCGEIGFPVTVKGSDPYRLDRDKDGIGCD